MSTAAPRASALGTIFDEESRRKEGNSHWQVEKELVTLVFLSAMLLHRPHSLHPDTTLSGESAIAARLCRVGVGWSLLLRYFFIGSPAPTIFILPCCR